MRNLGGVARLVSAELHLWKAAMVSPGAVLAIVPVLGALGYLLGPWDLIPSRVPYIGHLDELTIIVAAFLAARVLLPADALVDAAGRLGDGGTPSAGRARLISVWLVLRRRIMRTRDHLAAYWPRVAARFQRAAHMRHPADIAFHALGYRLWWKIRSIGRADVSSATGFIVVGGSPRSGTTLLRTLLGRHAMIASGPEITVFLKRISSPQDLGSRLGWDPAEIEHWQFLSRSQVEFIERFGNAMRERAGKPFWLEKTPRNVGRFRYIRRHFPQAKLVHIVRDGRDVICSLRRTPFARLDHAAPDSANAAVRCAIQWRAAVEAGIRLRGDPNYYELRYEDLVAEPERTLRDLLGFLGLPWDDAILKPAEVRSGDADEIAANSAVFDSSHGRWARELSADEKPALGVLIGPTLMKLGYADGPDWATSATH